MTADRNKKFDVLCVGQGSWDVIMRMDRHPGADEKATATERLEMGGGPAANASVTVARLGGRAAFAGYLGRDAAGEAHLAELQREGVDTAWVGRGEVSTAYSVILVKPDGHRTVVNHREPPPSDYFREWDAAAMVASARLLLFDGHEPDWSLELVDEARRQGVLTVLDAGSLHRGTEALAGRVDWLVASEKYARQVVSTPEMSGLEMIEKLRATCRQVIITMGERGLVYALPGDKARRYPALPIQARDTTGAGDVFHGAFSLGLARDFAFDKCLELARAAAARCCERLGARSGIPTLAELDLELPR